MPPIRTLAALLACTVAFDAAALSCGDAVGGHVVLTADLHCTSGWTALYVATPGTTIELNGHTLSGDVALEGIDLHEAPGTTIKGPGVIRGFWAGVNGIRSHDLRVEGVDFADLGTGVGLVNSDRVTVERNHFSGVRGHAVRLSHFPGAPGGSVGGHRIVDNLVEDAAYGVLLCGVATGNSLVAENSLARVSDYGIHVESGSAGNRIEGNVLVDMGNTGINISGSSHTTVHRNTFKRGRIGIALNPQPGAYCDAGSSAGGVRGTTIEGNGIFEYETAVVAGLGLDASARVTKNRIGGNKFYYDRTGVLFLEDAHWNDATGNAYAGTVDPVLDFGHGNAW